MVAVRASQHAAHQRDIAISAQLSTESQLVGDTNPVLSKLLSVAAWRIDSSGDARYAMLATAARPGIAVLTGHTAAVGSVAFSPDGKTLASGSADGTARLWDVATHRQITALAGHAGAAGSVAFSPDGKALASGSADQTVRLWDVSYLVDVVQHLCASAGRPVTPAEWARYVPGPSYQRVCP